MSELKELVNEFACRSDERLFAKIVAITDEDGMVDLGEFDRVWTRHCALIERFFSRWIRRVRARDARIAEQLAGELEPLRVLLQKRTNDLLWPH